ncbi:MAG TPA: aspartate-semialdehyde dehydrogenase [Bacteroidales bacterium]|jgi:aspartate-semialdehyde dehydrogenase|nr:aspartate-semialdehyde dehydrogenase [Bacteroidota bacterium]MAE08083.1 aspartate-semialdehyde dehydrogenase [Bacteroidota bacterium]HJN05239.1 aspartate-semialdehyde dehydrogenase [Bacteroidales bacterium]|tara:strand:+ start:719 stop:1708 length:990 start_codon:yes stop_codon:yes gene_type:complete
MKIAVVGATGLVGKEILQVLEERNVPVTEFLPVASSNSVGKKVIFSSEEYEVISIENAIAKKPDIAIFSAGGETSLKWAPSFADLGTKIIDNSSAWRMNDNVPLIVPEINGVILKNDDSIIANPNCSTIQLVMALSPLHKKYNIKRLVISTYQSVSGSGVLAVNQLMEERAGKEANMAYPHKIDLNIIPHAGNFDVDGYTTEETKLVNETNKILQSNIKVTATVVRVPVVSGHSEAVNIEFENDFVVEEVKRLLGNMPGVVVFDFPEANLYPMPILAQGKDEVFVGRLRRDFSQPNCINLWIVSDNLRKGAATNAVQIAQYLITNNLTK